MSKHWMRVGLLTYEGAGVFRCSVESPPVLRGHVAFEIGLFEGPFALILLPDFHHVLCSAGSRLEICAEVIDVHLAID